MNDSGEGKSTASGIKVKYYKRDFWSQENLKYARPHFRLEKAARIINGLSRGRERSLLDVGCGRPPWRISCHRASGTTGSTYPYLSQPRI